jgi:hypothetical protein
LTTVIDFWKRFYYISATCGQGNTSRSPAHSLW